MKTPAFVILGLFLAINLYAQSPSIDSLNKLLSKIPAGADTSRANLLLQISNHWTRINPDTALFFAKLAHSLSLKKNFRKGMAESFSTQAWVQINIGKFGEGLEQYNKALNIFTELNDEKGKAAVYNGLGVMYGMQENYMAALPYFLKALTLFEKNKTTTGITSSYIKIGTLYQKLHEYDKALENFKKANYFAQQVDDKINQASALNNMAVIYGITHQYQKCLEATAKSRQLAEQSGSISGLAISYLNTGMAYSELKRFGLADSSLRKALQYFKVLKNREQIARTYNGIATSLYGQQDHFNAKKFIDSSNAIARQLNNKAILYDNYDALVSISKAEGKFEIATSLYDTMLMLKDSLYNFEKTVSIERVKAAYDEETKQKTIETLKKENAIKTSQRNVLLIAVVCGLLLVLLLAFSLLELKKKNKLLVNSRKDLKNLNDLKDKFFSILSHDMRTPIGNILLVIDFLDSDMQVSEEEKKDLFKKLKSATSSTLETMDNLLTWGKFQSRNITQAPVEIDLKETVARVCRFLEQTAANKSITMVNRIEDPLTVQADKDQLEFILRNLVSNSIKFSFPGNKVEIWARKVDGSICIYIRDFGTGMSAKIQQNLFAPGTKVSINGTAGEIGSGLGLLLCKEFIEQNKGTLTVKSEEGMGTTFAIKMPAQKI